MRNAVLALALLLGAAIPGSLPHAADAADAEAGDPAEDKAARVAALQFLRLVDDGSYTQTWDYAGHYLRAVSTRDEWAQGLASARGHAGSPHSRDLLGTRFAPRLEDGKSGRYYTVFYVSRFGEKYWQEKVTLARQGNAWVVEGYYILPSDSSGQPTSP
jgi:hypothetical protein